jgi:hypothetical protein
VGGALKEKDETPEAAGAAHTETLKRAQKH